MFCTLSVALSRCFCLLLYGQMPFCACGFLHDFCGNFRFFLTFFRTDCKFLHTPTDLRSIGQVSQQPKVCHIDTYLCSLLFPHWQEIERPPAGGLSWREYRYKRENRNYSSPRASRSDSSCMMAGYCFSRRWKHSRTAVTPHTMIGPMTYSK